MLELIVRAGNLVTPEGVQQADLGVSGGQIVQIAPEITEPARQEIKAEGLHVFPGLIDVHVHFNEPGQAHWEGIATGSAALAAGGGTAFFDMPLNSLPCTLDGPSFDQKLAAMRASSHTDFALWGGLTPANLQNLPELAERGVIGFKAFMSNSGLPEFPACDDATLYEGMRLAARLGLPVAVHAESEAITSYLAQQKRQQGQTSWRDYLQTRPVFTELEAIQRALLFAQETGCQLHIVHISSGAGAVLAAEARARGVDVSLETCPHYLAFTEDDLGRLGGVGKCAPPLRSRSQQDLLWDQVLQGQIDLIASDHSPSPPEMKQGHDFLALWGGIAGVQSTLAVLLSEGWQRRGLALERLAALLSANPARRFGLAGKGLLAEGYDADFTLVDLQQTYTLKAQDLYYRHPISPYLGRSFVGVVRETWLRGQRVYALGKIEKPSEVRLLKGTIPFGTDRWRGCSPRGTIPFGTDRWRGCSPRGRSPSGQNPDGPVHPEASMSLTGFTRTHVAPDHALLTPDTFVRAPLPGWKNTACIVHISPELGARFKMYTVEMEPRGSGEMTLLDIQRFAYVLEGAVALEVGGARHTLGAHHYAYLPANTPHRFEAVSKARLVVFDKPYQALAGVEAPSLVLGHEPDIQSSPLLGDEALQVRLLLPDNPSFDMAVNTMTFAPGAHLALVETHVMEHGLLFLEGSGIYRLADRWYTVQAGDVIWMASYCPQWFGALGKTPSKYLIYKDVNRHSLELLS